MNRFKIASNVMAVGVVSFSILATARGDVVLAGGGLGLMEQGGTFAAGNVAGASAGGIPFSSSDLGAELGIPFHRAVNLNDEIYGNSNSWIGAGVNPFPAPFAGVALDSSITLRSIAFGRSNGVADPACGGAPCMDRWPGLYTLQYTTVAGPGAGTPDADWTTIGTLDYQSAGSLATNFSQPWLRHRYNFDPVAGVSGVRLLVPATGISGGTAIDEVELYEMAGAFVPPPPPIPNLVLSPAPDFGIGFNGNNGLYSTPDSPALAPDNLALASHGSIPFASSALGVEFGFPFPLHHVAALNDGEYGDTHSWIGADLDPMPNAGVALDGLFFVTSIAWGRDNGNVPGDCCGGNVTDRDLGVYTIQYTQVPGADHTTPETGSPFTGWATIGTVDLRMDEPGVFDAHLRHEFTIQHADGRPILASAFRLKVPGTGISEAGTAIDEIELYGRPIPEPSSLALAIVALAALVVTAVARSHRA